jgi:hypothetical protein
MKLIKFAFIFLNLTNLLINSFFDLLNNSFSIFLHNKTKLILFLQFFKLFIWLINKLY